VNLNGICTMSLVHIKLYIIHWNLYSIWSQSLAAKWSNWKW
jgi:hypothetical protein